MRKLMLLLIPSLMLLQACQSESSIRGVGASGQAQKEQNTPPNIVLIVFEDMSPRIGAYGDAVANTPVLDELASQGIMFTNAFTTSGVCAPSRAALITGVHQQILNAQHMRTNSPVPGLKAGGPIEYKAVPPAHVKAFPEYLRAAGYYTTNDIKTDYQFGEPFTIWDENGKDASWTNREDGQPFFSMITLMKTHESYIWPEDMQSDNPLVNFVVQRNKRELAGKLKQTKPSEVEVPPYLPDTLAVREDIARHYDNIAFTEKEISKIIQSLEEQGVLDNTIIIITSDHGDGLPRMKRSVFDAGLKVPLIVLFPERYQQRTRIEQSLVSFVDIAPSILSLAGTKIPEHMQGRNIFSTASARDYIYAAADRHDNVLGQYRAVRDQRYKYIRNSMPEQPFFSLLAFRSVQPSMQALWQGLADNTLTPVQAQYFASPQPQEMLFDTQIDPHEINNLAAEPQHRDTLIRMRNALDAWLASNEAFETRTEKELIKQIWPNMEQPTTQTPTISQKNQYNSVVMQIQQEGASIGYRLADEKRWKLYTAPIDVPSGKVIEAKAIRYGYKESEVVSFVAQ